jgi:hypothetical protein
MKSVLAFFSLLALAFLAAGMITVVGSNSLGRLPAEGFAVDHASLLLGIALGFCLATLARVSWAEMPRRLVLWVQANERNFVRLAWASIFVAVLLYY